MVCLCGDVMKMEFDENMKLNVVSDKNSDENTLLMLAMLEDIADQINSAREALQA